MALRRGVWVVLILIIVAVTVSVAGMLLVYGGDRARAASVEPRRSCSALTAAWLKWNRGASSASFSKDRRPCGRCVVMLHRAKSDTRISSLILKPTSAAALWGKVQEVRDAVLDFRRSGKPAVAYLEDGGEQEFYLATACDKVFLTPSATLDLTGMASYELFLRGTLDKIGAYPRCAAHRRIQDLLEHLHPNTPIRRRIARWPSRSTPTCTNNWCAASPRAARRARATSRRSSITVPFSPRTRCAPGLIDDLAYEDELDDKAKLGSGKLHYLDMNDSGSRPLAASASAAVRGSRSSTPAGLIASGKSTYDSTGSEVVGSETLIEYLRKARADNSVKAIVLRVDSPGGSAIASDVIWREVLLTRNAEAADRVDV